MKKVSVRFAIFVSILLVASLACNMSAVFAEPTPVPTYTPQPTYTPFPTATPIPTAKPAVPGIDVPLKTEGMSLTLDAVSLLDSYDIEYMDAQGKLQKQTLTPQNKSDYITVVFFKGSGQIKNVAQWPNQTSVFLEDNSGSRSMLAGAFYTPSTGVVRLIFATSRSATSLLLTFPDGQTIDLTSFLK